ncbi:MAG: putative diguanylate cyclase DgcQ [Pseudomonas citronellolis]|nr:MAG: putative diguanylate cyclase DgcQ [Pseudomonas citronellolis]
MLACPLPIDESQRQRALDEMAVLDTPAEHYLDALVELAQNLARVDTVLISLIDQDRQWFKARIGLDASETQRDISFCGHTILGDGPLVVPDATADERFADNPLVVGAPFIRFYVGQPLHAANGQPIGTLCMLDPRPRHIDARELANFRQLATLAEGYLQLRALLQRNQDLRDEIGREQRRALLDSLTQLWNRGALVLFHDREQRLATERQQLLGVLYGDLDHFKSVNDRFGHAAGDQVLCEAARRLRATLRPDDLVVRQGGEEFVALVKVQDEIELRRIAERVRQAMADAPVPLGDSPLPISMSLGCTVERDGETLQSGLERADAALYNAKQNGRNRVEFNAPPAA